MLFVVVETDGTPFSWPLYKIEVEIGGVPTPRGAIQAGSRDPAYVSFDLK